MNTLNQPLANQDLNSIRLLALQLKSLQDRKHTNQHDKKRNLGEMIEISREVDAHLRRHRRSIYLKGLAAVAGVPIWGLGVYFAIDLIVIGALLWLLCNAKQIRSWDEFTRRILSLWSYLIPVWFLSSLGKAAQHAAFDHARDDILHWTHFSDLEDYLRIHKTGAEKYRTIYSDAARLVSALAVLMALGMVGIMNLIGVNAKHPFFQRVVAFSLHHIRKAEQTPPMAKWL